MEVQKMNVNEVLRNVEKRITELQINPWKKRFKISEVCNELGIFDWWNEYLSMTQLKDMRKFLKEAIKLGYTGYACFKVGATGCANGMWAYKEESTTGYSPDCDAIYKSFTPAYNYWQISVDDKWYPCSGEFDSLKNIKQLESYIEERGW